MSDVENSYVQALDDGWIRLGSSQETMTEWSSTVYFRAEDVVKIHSCKTDGLSIWLRCTAESESASRVFCPAEHASEVISLIFKGGKVKHVK